MTRPRALRWLMLAVMSLPVTGQLNTVRTLSGADLFGPIVAIDAQGVVTVGGQADVPATKIALSQVFEIGSSKGSPAPKQPTDTLWLRSGWSMTGTLESGSERQVSFRPLHCMQPIQLPVRFLTALRVAPTEAAAGQLEKFTAGLVKPSERDLLFLIKDRDLTRLSIELAGFRDQAIEFRYANEDRTLPFEDVFGVVFSRSGGAAPDVAPGLRVVLSMTSGNEYRGRILSLDAAHCTLRIDEGVDLVLDRQDIARIAVQTDALAYLTDLTPKIEQLAALDRVWPSCIDCSPRGDAIRLAGKRYTRGIVLFPRSKLTVALSAKFDWFETALGIEDGAGPMGDARIAILADGKTVFECDSLRAGQPAKSLKLDMRGVHSLVLEADFGNNLDLGDHCVFAQARFWKEQ